MLDSEFTTDYNFLKNECPPLKKASIVGIWKHNKIRRMIAHHKAHH